MADVDPMMADERCYSDFDAILSTPDQPTDARVQRSRSWDRSWDEMLLDTQTRSSTIGRILAPELTRGASLSTTIFNLVSTCLGAGMLALPFMLKRIGIGGGLCLIVVIPFIAERTIASVLFASDATGQLSLAHVAEQSLGRAGAVATCCALVTLPFGVCVSYCIVIKSLLPHILQSLLALPSPPHPTLVLAIVCVAALVPLTSLRTLEQLRFASLASIVLVYSFVAAVATAGALVLFVTPASGSWQGFSSQQLFRGSVSDWCSEVPVVCFSYLCHPNVLYLYQELRRQHLPDKASRWASKRAKMLSATRVAYLACALIYVVEAVGGYAAFGVSSRQDLLENFEPGGWSPLPDAVGATLHGAFVAVMVLTFPSVSFSLRGTMHSLALSDVPETAVSRWSEAAVLVAAVGAVAACVDDLGLVFQLVGATCGAFLMFVLPSVAFLLERRRAATANSAARASRTNEVDAPYSDATARGDSPALVLQDVVAWAILVLGIGVAIMGTATAFT